MLLPTTSFERHLKISESGTFASSELAQQAVRRLEEYLVQCLGGFQHHILPIKNHFDIDVWDEATLQPTNNDGASSELRRSGSLLSDKIDRNFLIV